MLWPLFARAPCHWFLEFFLLSFLGVRSVLFLLRPVGRRDPSAGPEPKINTSQGVFFFAPAPAKGRVFCFFALAPPKGRGAQRGATKKPHFAHPGTTAKQILETNDTGHEQKGATKKKAQAPTHSLRPWTAMLTHFFSGATFPAGPGWGFVFLLRPRADAHSLTAGLGGDASRRGGLFFFCCGPARTGVCVFLFFGCGPARTLTHSLWVGAISARPGW